MVFYEKQLDIEVECFWAKSKSLLMCEIEISVVIVLSNLQLQFSQNYVYSCLKIKYCRLIKVGIIHFTKIYAMVLISYLILKITNNYLYLEHQTICI